MKIAYCCADAGVPVFGQKGCSLHVQEMLRAFVQLGAQVTLFASQLGGPVKPDLAAINIVTLPDLSGLKGHLREHAAIDANAALADAMQQHGPFDFVYERYALWSFAAQELAHQWHVPGVLEVNAPLIEEQQRYRKLCLTTDALRTTQQAFLSATALVAVSEAVATYVNTFPEAQHKVHVLPNGVNVSRFAACQPTLKAAEDAPQRPFTVGFVGTLKPWHGVDTLLHAFADFQLWVDQSRLLIVGQGPELESLQQLSKTLGIDADVDFVGAVATEAVPELLARMDVATAPYPETPDFYFSPLKVYEYMAAGLAVVASDLGQLSQLVTHEKDGLLCPAGCVDSLSDALLTLYTSPALRRRLGQHAQAKMQAGHTWAQVADKVLAIGAASDWQQRGCA